MNRNSDYAFSMAPTLNNVQRSRFRRYAEHKTTFNAADIVPLYWSSVLPGDTIDMSMSAVVRMSTPVFPVMDNAYFDYYWFFVPNRIIWNHWKEFCGENTSAPWIPTTEYHIPKLKIPTGGFNKGTLADYLGIPIGKGAGQEVNALPFRVYASIYNEWFRDQNLKYPCNLPLGDATVNGSNGTDYVTDTIKGGALCKAAKAHDYFTSALPAPQKSAPVEVSLGNYAPVVSVRTSHDVNKLGNYLTGHEGESDYQNGAPLHFTTNRGGTVTDKHTLLTNLGDVAAASSSSSSSTLESTITPSNLYADLGSMNGVTINQLRQAFAVQRFYEKQSLAGSRYRETLRSMFGVSSPDARMMIPEYLGGDRVYINVNQVVQTSSTDSTSPQGNTAAFSCTGISNGGRFTWSSTEHGYIMCVGVVRTDHTYQQGLDREWSRDSMFDFYWPAFAQLGAQSVKNKELYFSDDAAVNDQVFGYQEAWADYRYSVNRVSGEFRSDYQTPLDSWHYADHFTQTPVLNSDFIDETLDNIDRTLAVQHTVSDQFIADFHFSGVWTRPMPLYSVPGLIDHY